MNSTTALFGILLSASAFSDNKPEAKAPPYALSQCNYMDMGMEGYCLGMSSVHAISRMPNEKIKGVFGDKIATYFAKNPALDEDSAYELLRVFSTLQKDNKFLETMQKLPEIPTKQTLEANGKIPQRFKSLMLKSDPAQAKKLANERMKTNLDFLQSAKGQAEGLFANVIVVTPGPTLLGLHSLYLVSAKEENGKYRFEYLDPNHPKVLHTMVYDPTDTSTHFSTDTPTISSILTETYDVDLAYKTFGEIVGGMQDSDDGRSRILLSYLKLPGAKAEFNRMFQGRPFGDDPEMFRRWYGRTTALVENAAKHSAKGWKVMDFSKGPKPSQPKIDRASLASSVLQKKAADEGIESYLSISLAAQNQLDLGCENFRGFVTQVLEPLKKGYFKDARIHLKEFKDLYEQRKQQSDPPVGPTSISKILVDKIVAWANLANRDGKREGIAPKRNLDQEACIQNTIMPEIARMIARENSIAWGFLMDRPYVNWMLKNFDFTSHDPKTIELIEGNLAHLSPETLIGGFLEASLSTDAKLRSNALAALKRLEALHAKVRKEWAADRKKVVTVGLPPAAFHRTLALWKGLELAGGEDFEGGYQTWKSVPLPSEAQQIVDRMKRDWSQFFKQEKLFPLISEARTAYERAEEENRSQEGAHD